METQLSLSTAKNYHLKLSHIDTKIINDQNHSIVNNKNIELFDSPNLISNFIKINKNTLQ